MACQFGNLLTGLLIGGNQRSRLPKPQGTSQRASLSANALGRPNCLLIVENVLKNSLSERRLFCPAKRQAKAQEWSLPLP
jgi:hypothetical protein